MFFSVEVSSSSYEIVSQVFWSFVTGDKFASIHCFCGFRSA